MVASLVTSLKSLNFDFLVSLALGPSTLDSSALGSSPDVTFVKHAHVMTNDRKYDQLS